MSVRDLPVSLLSPKSPVRWRPPAALVFAGVALAPGLARAAGPNMAPTMAPSMSECLSANESAIKLRGDHKLRQARDQSLLCAAASCPGEVREACQTRVRDLSAAMPSIVFLAKDAAGTDLVAVRVSMDGEVISDHLDGTAVAVDPGQHAFKFEVAGQSPVERSFIISEGQKDRREAVVMVPAVALPPRASSPAGSPPAPSVPPAPSDLTSGSLVEAAPASPGATQRLAGIVVGAAGIVGLGLGAVTGGIAASDWSNAKADCNGMPVSCTTSPSSPGVQDKNSAATMATISTAGFIAGGVLAATGVVLFFTAPKKPSGEAPASARRVEFAPTGGPGGAGMMIKGWF